LFSVQMVNKQYMMFTTAAGLLLMSLVVWRINRKAAGGENNDRS
jgi:hypothetical protein